MPAAAVAHRCDAPPAKPVPTKVVVGVHASCAVMSDRDVALLGRERAGPARRRHDRRSPDAGRRPRLKGVQDVVLGAAHACALLDDGSVACWGDIGFGKADHLAQPTGVPGVNDAKHVFAVGAASCATMSNGAFVCWGDIDRRATCGSRAARASTACRRRARARRCRRAHRGRRAARRRRRRIRGAATACRRRRALSRHHRDRGGRRRRVRPDEGRRRRVRGRRAALRTAEPARAGTEAAKHRGKGKKAQGAEASRRPRRRRRDARAAEGAPPRVRRRAVRRHGDRPPGVPATEQPVRARQPVAGPDKIDIVDGHCARSTDGTVRCWQVDRKSRTVAHDQRRRPVRRRSRRVRRTAARCSTTTQVVCWGENAHGELGRGTADTGAHPEAAPVALYVRLSDRHAGRRADTSDSERACRRGVARGTHRETPARRGFMHATIDPMLPSDDLQPERVRPLSRREYDQLVALGVFEDERIELLRGMLVTMSPQGDVHAGLTAWLAQQLTLSTGGAYDVRSHSPFAADDYSEPEPDVVVARRREKYAHPEPPQVLLLIEVSDSSLRKDRRIKLRSMPRPVCPSTGSSTSARRRSTCTRSRSTAGTRRWCG